MEKGLHPEKIDIRYGILKKKLLNCYFLKQQSTLYAIKKLLKVLSQIWMWKTDSVGLKQDDITEHTAAPIIDF